MRSLALPTTSDAISSRASTSTETQGLSEKLRVKKFANGDEYHGMWADGKPDGEGVYTWADKSSYQGTWSKGVKHGVGKYTWPSGAVYTGEWKSGYMHGMGTFTAPDNTYYRGSWAWDLKHGLGKKVYANGDIYEGLWKQGKSEGPGHYRWRDGNEYDGEWKGGRMHGKGTFVWKSGERYDGEWVEGQEQGIGVFTWADKSLYDGFWEAGRKHGIGIFWPATLRKRASRTSGAYSEEDGLQRPLHMVPSYGKSIREMVEESDEHDEEAAPATESPIEVPSLSHAAEQGSPGNVPAGASESGSVVLREYKSGKLVQEKLVSSAVLESMLHVSHSAIKRMEKNKALQRPGETIYKGHESYDLMVALQQGIRHSIGSVTSARMPPALSENAMQQAVKVDFPRSGSNTTPPHPSDDFSWKDYAPLAFRKLREMFEIDAGDYMLSLCGDQALRELKTPGKSGSVFYLSHDDRFMVKTMRKEEMKILLDMLPKYYRHVTQHPHTLLTKFYGLHRMKPSKGRKVRFVVMGNIMRTDLPVHRVFDLKGSSVGRVTEGKITPTTVLKDLDLDCTFRLEEGWRDRFVRQMGTDCSFLEASRVMDYSLLLGIHYRDNKDSADESIRNVNPLEAIQESRNGEASTSANGQGSDGGPTIDLAQVAETHGIETRWLTSLMQLAQRRVVIADAQDKEQKATQVLAKHPMRSSSMRPVAFAPGATDDIAAAFHQPSVKLGTNIAATAIPNQSTSGTEPYDVVLLFGIIDVLQEYDYRKRVEHAWKSMQYDGGEISAVNPKAYSERFQAFMKGVFL